MTVPDILAVFLVFPEGAPMRGDELDQPIIKSPFMDSLVPIIAILFLVPGYVYGKVTKSIKNDKDVANQMSETMASMGMLHVLSFIAGQLVAYLYSSYNDFMFDIVD